MFIKTSGGQPAAYIFGAATTIYALHIFMR